MFVACDESGKEPEKKYLVIGSVWVEKDDLIRFEEEVTRLRLKRKCWGEVEWLKVKGHTSEDILQFYKDFLSLAFGCPRMCFRFILVEKALLDKKTYHEGQKSDELPQLKFMYLLISRYANRFLSSEEKKGLHIIFDQFEESKKSREERWRLQTKEFIERSLSTEIEHFQPCTSHICSLVQLCDVVTGAVATRWNTLQKDRAPNQSKEILIQHIETLSNKPLGSATSPFEKKFNIWRWRPGAFSQNKGKGFLTD